MAKSLEEIKNNVVSLLGQSEKIHDLSHVNLQVITKGMLFWKKTTLLLNGRVNREIEKDEIMAIIARELPNVELVDKLRIEHR